MTNPDQSDPNDPQWNEDLAKWAAWESAVFAAVDLIKAAPFKPDGDNEKDPSETHLYRAARELVAAAVERGCALHMLCAFIEMDLANQSDKP